MVLLASGSHNEQGFIWLDSRFAVSSALDTGEEIKLLILTQTETRA